MATIPSEREQLITPRRGAGSTHAHHTEKLVLPIESQTPHEHNGAQQNTGETGVSSLCLLHSSSGGVIILKLMNYWNPFFTESFHVT